MSGKRVQRVADPLATNGGYENLTKYPFDARLKGLA